MSFDRWVSRCVRLFAYDLLLCVALLFITWTEQRWLSESRAEIGTGSIHASPIIRVALPCAGVIRCGCVLQDGKTAEMVAKGPCVALLQKV
jgi:hypothetical protein